ncbi:response regulator transcription factor [Peptoniphilus sp. KCTC 25270]|uniref:response regulator transcription factor n=1 Tax=Peptoniphilus sp. KCTC 25270 TaxID=2897414 RepID=UPI001E3C292B|nr:response regulator transcription factor [Peptoniphilus sp. KCTC 25270]MCD1146938.1 response regulator transcription factor [Peptoniphilus sp. KCTC 25270]
MIYCVEDEQNIRELILYALENQDFQVKGFESSENLYSAMEKEKPELLLLDIMLPEEDGLTILKKIRHDPRYRDLPVIMLTAKSSELDRIVGLDLGADDYIVKPFSVLELIARVKSLLRRANRNGVQESTLCLDDVCIDVNQRMVTVEEEPINLTYKEFELLLYLFRNINIVLPREKIMSTIWGYDFEGESRTVDVHIASIRQKLGSHSHLIETVRNVGYKVGNKK